MHAIQIRTVGLPDRSLLVRMYDRFDPSGMSLGVPPFRAEARREWIEAALGHKVNLAAFSASGETVGHCFLVAGSAGSAELAVFVNQEFRRRGIGTVLVKAVLESAAMAGFARVWTLTSSDNKAALGLQLKCGFRVTNSAFTETELEVELPVPRLPAHVDSYSPGHVQRYLNG